MSNEVNKNQEDDFSMDDYLSQSKEEDIYSDVEDIEDLPDIDDEDNDLTTEDDNNFDGDFEAQYKQFEEQTGLREQEKAIEDGETGEEENSDANNNLDEAKANQQDKQAAEVSNLEVYEINDDFIISQPEEDRKILENLKGEKVSGKMLKSYINAQRLIGKKVISDSEYNEKFSNDTKPKKAIEFDDNAKGFIEQKTNELLKTKFKDLPADTSEFQEYMSDLAISDPERFHDLRDVKKELRQQVEQDFQKVLYVKENYASINETVFNQEIESIKEQLKDFGIENPAELGFDFTNARDNAKITKLLEDANGNLSNEMVDIYADVPLMKKQALSDKFMRVYAKEIIQAIRDNTAKTARKEGFKSANDKKNLLPINSLAKNNTSGAYANLTVEKALSKGDIDSAYKLFEKEMGIK